MIDFIPLPLYVPLFNYVILFLIIIVLIQGSSNSIFSNDTRYLNNIIGAVLAVAVILHIGLRPITAYYFGDTINYANSFYFLQANYDHFTMQWSGEWFFDSIMLWFSVYGNINLFFLFCAFIYVGALWWALKRIFREDYFIPLIVVMSMFTFYTYGVNGVRNGMASSIVILALSFRRNIPLYIGLCILALGVHKSLALTVFASALALFVKNPKIYLWGWLGAFVVSLTTGEMLSNFLLSYGLVGDDRLAGYINSDASTDTFSSVGFRWDFLLYSSIPVIVGWYFIFKRNYTDKFYIWLFNIYLTTNAFWIIVIRANFSNRFAQISWFIMPLVLIYPFFMKKFWDDQPRKIGWAVLFFYLYTFYSVMI